MGTADVDPAGMNDEQPLLPATEGKMIDTPCHEDKMLRLNWPNKALWPDWPNKELNRSSNGD